MGARVGQTGAAKALSKELLKKVLLGATEVIGNTLDAGNLSAGSPDGSRKRLIVAVLLAGAVGGSNAWFPGRAHSTRSNAFTLSDCCECIDCTDWTDCTD